MGSCYSKSSEHNTKDMVGVGVGVGVGTREGTVRQSSFGSGRWVKIGSISRRKSACYEGVEVVNKNHKESHKMIVNGASDVACLYTQQGKKGTNQDAMVVWENYSLRSDTIFCGVFDGHGPFGHMVAKKVRDTLPLIIYNHWKGYSGGKESFKVDKDENVTESVTCDETETTSMDDQWHESEDTEEGDKFPEICIPLKRSMLRAFNLMDKELKLLPTIDCFCSGTTAVTLVKQGLDLMLANIGDSRAVLATRSEDNSLVAVQLTVDLKPDLPREAARIQQCKGRVFALQDEPEVARVWLPNNDSPGLAMARAFGDFCLKDFGLISVPDIYYRRLTKRDRFIILATDGVWDVLSNKEAIDIVASAPTRATAARALVDCAVRSWRLKYPTSKNDDCAVVCLFLEHETSTTEVIPANGTVKDLDNEPKTATEDAEVPTNDEDSHASVLERSGTLGPKEIVPVSEETEANICKKNEGRSKRSLAECISTAEEDEWSALEGFTRVNSLLSLPRFLSSDKRSSSWRKWL